MTCSIYNKSSLLGQTGPITEPAEAEKAEVTGTVALALCCSVVVCMMLTDLITIQKDLLNLKENLTDGWYNLLTLKQNYGHVLFRKERISPHKNRSISKGSRNHHRFGFGIFSISLQKSNPSSNKSHMPKKYSHLQDTLK